MAVFDPERLESRSFEKSLASLHAPQRLEFGHVFRSDGCEPAKQVRELLKIPELNLYLANRKLPDWLAQLGNAPTLKYSVEGSLESVAEKLAELVGNMSSIDPKARKAWLQDMCELTRFFSAATDAVRVNIGLFSIRPWEAANTKFHLDVDRAYQLPKYQRFRLLCTYSGPGTLWTPNQNADRDLLEMHSSSLSAELRGLRRRMNGHDPYLFDPKLVFEFPTYSVGLIGLHVGRLEPMGLVHSGNRLRDTEEPRLLFRVDRA